MSDFVTVKEISERLQLDRRTVRRMIDNHAIPGVLRKQRPIRISRDAFDRWLKGAAA